MNFRRIFLFIPILLFAGISAALIVFGFPTHRTLHPTKSAAEGGSFDLTGWNPHAGKIVALDGEWELYWDNVLAPSDFSGESPPVPDALAPIPGAWKNLTIDGEHLPPRGYATYRLVTLLPEGPHPPLALKITEMANDYSLYANGRLMVGAPEAAPDPERSVPDNYPIVLPIGDPGERLEIIMVVSNYHIRRGGIWHSIYLGEEESVRNMKVRSLLLEMFLFGGILITGFYHLTLYVSFRKEPSPLFFGLFCIVTAFRVLVTGEYYLATLIPTIGWRTVLILEYSTFYFGMPLMACFVYSLYPREIRKFFPWTIIAICSVALLLIYTAPTYISSYSIIPMQAITVVGSLYSVAMVLVAFIRKRQGAEFFLLGFLGFFAMFVNDVLYNYGIVHTGYLIGFGLLLFIFFQTVLLSVRFSNAFREVEALSEDVIRAEKKYRTLAESATDVIFTHDADRRVTYVNPAGVQLSGYSEDELLNRSYVDFMPPDHAKDILESTARRTTNYDETVSLEVEYVNKHGRHFHMDVTNTAIIENDQPAGFLVVARDITEKKEIDRQLEQYRNHLEELVTERTAELRKINIELEREISERIQTEDALRISEEKYRNLFETSRDAIYIMTRDGRYEDFNTAAEEITGYTRRELLDMNITDVHADPTLAKQYQHVIDETGFIKDYEVIYRRKDGTFVHCLETTTVRHAPDGSIIGYQGIVKNISELKRMEGELRTAKIRAEDANRAKSEFLANVSHEIRTPMNGILGFTELLMEEDLTKSQKESLAIIQESGETLLSLINDILDLSKIESGKMEIFPEEFDPYDLVEQVLVIIRPRAMKKGINLFLTPSNLTVKTVITDVDKLRHILLNLLGNAMKFTDEGFVEATVEVRTDDNGGRLVISIIDTGIGISKENQARIFEPFTQVDGGITRTYGGTGLGLTITRNFLNLLGGSLEIASREGKGSTFTIFLPVSLPDPPTFRPAISGRREILETIRQSEPEHIIPTSGATLGNILLVEDNEVNQRFISRLLSDGGFDVTLAQNGAVALEILSENTFDLILMDLQMPVMDGYEAIRYIKEDPNLSGVPIVAITAHAMKKDKKRALDAGCVGFLTKPIRKDALMAEVSVHTGISSVESGPKTVHRESMKDIYHDFVQSLPGELERLTAAVALSDFHAVGRIGHDLKGLAGVFGRDVLSKIGKKIEAAVRDESLDDLEHLILQLEGEIETILLEQEDAPDKG